MVSESKILSKKKLNSKRVVVEEPEEVGAIQLIRMMI